MLCSYCYHPLKDEDRRVPLCIRHAVCRKCLKDRFGVESEGSRLEFRRDQEDNRP